MRAVRHKGCTDAHSPYTCECIVRAHADSKSPSARLAVTTRQPPHPPPHTQGLLSLTETNVDTWHRGTCSQLTRCLIKVIYWFIYGRLEAAV